MSGFSIIIPTRDRPAFLREALHHALHQELPPHEIIVIDDGEGAAAVCRAVSPAITVLGNRRQGPVAARNLGVSHATGDYIAFLDDDDLWIDPQHLVRASRALSSGADFCFSDGRLVFGDGRLPLTFAFDADHLSLERDNTILTSAVAYRRQFHNRLGLFDESLPYYWDWDWFLRVARSGATFCHIAAETVLVRIHAHNMSGDSTEPARQANLDRLAAKHGLTGLILKNHLSVAEEGLNRTG